jgi:glycosyltransferase involved in cell wall biosynthesis
MKVSIIIPVLNSHEIARRQVLHFEKMDLPDDVEIIMVDDGSVPEIEVHTTLKNFKLIHTHDYRAWTWPLARNRGAREAWGEYFIMADLDHIISRSFIDLVRGYTADHIRVNREFAVLDENGNLTQDHEVLKEYGLTQKRLDDKGVTLTPHRNQFAMHKDLYWKLGGFREDRIGLPYPQREDGDFNKKWQELYAKGEIKDFDDVVGYEHRPVLYMFPNGKYCGDVDYNPKGLFHTLTRKTEKNKSWKT